MSAPPGWPDGVRPPEAPGWQRSAVNWLLDHCPADYRGYPLLQRHPDALAHLATHHVDAELAAARAARATARADLADRLAPAVIEELLVILDSEEARLLAARRAVALIAGGFRGDRHVPRL